MVFAIYEGKKIYYQITGNGPCVVLLHGFMEDSSIWNELTQLLKKNYRVVIVDLPGHAQSEILGASQPMEKMAAVVWTVLATEGIREACVVGHSLGGYVAVEMAKLEPTRVKGICLLHSTVLADSDIKKKERDRVIKVLEMSPAVFIKEAIPNLFAAALKSAYQQEIEDLTQLALRHPVSGLIATTRGMRDRENALPWLQRTHLPVHFIIGKNDSVIPFEFYKDQLTAGKHVTHFISERAGHMGFIEDKELVYASILSFCSSNA